MNPQGAGGMMLSLILWTKIEIEIEISIFVQRIGLREC
jgi:hypothetical protein